MDDCKPCVAEIQQQGKIPTQLEQQGRALISLHEAIDDLGCKLVTVLGPKEDEPETDKDKSAIQEVSPVAKELTVNVSTIYDAAYRLRKLTERIEL